MLVECVVIIVIINLAGVMARAVTVVLGGVRGMTLIVVNTANMTVIDIIVVIASMAYTVIGTIPIIIPE